MGIKRQILNSLPVRLMRRSAIRYDEDGLTTINAAPFLEDPVFLASYRAGVATGSWGESTIRWRAHVVLWAANSALGVEGDFAECGVNRGGLARAIVEMPEWRAAGRRFSLLDTFEGFDPRFPPEDAGHWKYESAYLAVQETFTPFEGVDIIKGPVPDTLMQIRSDRFAFVHIDMNAAPPERAALEFFWPKMVTGGIVVFDDYVQPGHQAQQQTLDAFARANGFQILSLPTGQGLALKR